MANGLTQKLFIALAASLLLTGNVSAQDSFEPDNSFDQATFTGLSSHTFHQPQDVDWFAFFLPQQEPLRITPGAGIAINGAGVGTGIAVDIYRQGADGRALFEDTLFAETSDVEILGFGSYLPPADGYYFIRLRPCAAADNPACAGSIFPAGGASYTVELPFTNFGFNGTGRLSGNVTDAQTGQPVFFATVSSSGNRGTFSNRTGAYTLVDVIGSYTATVVAPGYLSATFSYELLEFQTTIQDIALTPNLSFFRDGFEPALP